MTSGIAHTVHEGWRELRFDRPAAMNTLTLPVILAVEEALDEVAAAKARCLLITAEGKNFMAGGDLSYLREAGDRAPREAEAVIDALNRVMLRLTGLDCPTVIAVQGAVAGAGLSLVLACDLALAADNARFVFTYDRIAATPDGGLSWTLPRAVGLRRAMAIALSGEPIGASRAMEIGLLSEVAPAGLLQDRARELACRLATGPSQAYAAIRRLMLDGQDRGFADHLAAERESFCLRAGSEDFRGAIETFFERRKPEYRGR